MTLRTSYVYIHRRKSDGGIFYIGKGVKGRAYHTHSRNRWWRNIYKKHGRDVQIITGMMPEQCAMTIEKILISRHRSEICNITDGGQGASGYKHTPEVRRAISERIKGKKPPPLSAEAMYCVKGTTSIAYGFTWKEAT